MAHNLFAQFSNGVTGESEDEKHPGSAGWIEITDTNFTVKQEAAVGEDSDSTQVNFEEISLGKYIDTASASLIEGCLGATVYETVKIEILRAAYQGGASDPIPYLVVELKKVLIKKIETEYDEGSLPKETLTLEFGEFSFKYTPVDKKTGAPKAVIPISYSRFDNVVSAG